MTIDTRTDQEHVPAPEFLEYMEWELQRAFGRHRLGRRLRLAALIVATLGVGVTGGLASAQVRQGSARDSLLLAAQADLRLARVRLDLVRAQLDSEQRMMAVGALSSSVKAEIQVRYIEAEVARIQADIAEIRATGQSPRDELNAPTVNGQDFVSRRVDLQLAAAETRLRAAEQKLMETARRVRAGVVPEVHELEARAEMMGAKRDLAVFAEKRSLRREFLEKGTPVDQLAVRLERAELQQDVDLAQAQVQLARERVSAMRKARAAGSISELEVMRATIELQERMMEVQRLGMRVRAIRGSITPIRPIQELRPPGRDTLQVRMP